MRLSRAFVFSLGLAIGLGACGGGDELGEKPDDDGEGKEDAWNYQNDPDRFRVEFVYRLADLPQEGEATQSPWPDDYWSYYNDSINARWRGASTPSPAELYDLTFNQWELPEGYMDLRPRANRADEWDADYYTQLGPLAGEVHRRRGNADMVNGRDDDDDGEIDECDSEDCDGVEFWWGVCHAWAPASILEPEPVEPVEHNGQTFYPSDIKALMMINYDSAPSVMLGGRCNAREVSRDENGRATDSECQDVNAGAFHVVITNMLGRLGRAFAEDRTYDYQVWNQPIRGYEVTELREGLTASEANQVLGIEDGSYTYNEDAVSFAEVRMSTRYITESHPSEHPRIPQLDRYTRTDRYHYVLELDAEGNVIGGEWAGSSQSNHPDFLWLPTGHRTYFREITYQNVRMLLDLSRDDQEEPPQGEVFEVRPDLDIPDDDPTGVVATLEVDSDAAIEDLNVAVEIDHTYIGDLTVTLIRDGVERVLQDRQGGSDDNLVQSYHVTDFNGQSIGGTWQLRVVDGAGQDVGAIRRFALVATLGEGTEPVDPVEPGTYSLTEAVEIPDNDAAGTISVIDVADEGVIDTMAVRVNVEHTYIGDLIIELRHNGLVRTLHNRGGGGTDDLTAEYQISEFAGSSLQGQWELFVSDNASVDTGRIVEWSMQVTTSEEPPVEPTDAVAPSAAGQLVITEIHADPAGVYDQDGEWFELLNTTESTTFTLEGAVFSDDDSESFTVTGDIVVAPGERLVLGRSHEIAINGGAHVNFGYGNEMTLANGGDELVLTVDGVEIDRVAWTSSWNITRGASLQLAPTAIDDVSNDDVASWCVSLQEFGTVADRGTPGMPNHSCD